MVTDGGSVLEEAVSASLHQLVLCLPILALVLPIQKVR